MEEATKDSNSSRGLFGWQFQIAAAIYHFFDKVEKIKKIRVEGKNEDFELIAADGTLYFGQAKTIHTDLQLTDSSSRLKSALETLNNAYIRNRADNICLIYCSNSQTPFNNNNSFGDFYDGGTFKYEELNQRCKNVIDKEYKRKNYTFDRSQLIIHTLHFPRVDNNETKFKQLKNKISDVLVKVDNDLSIFTNQYMRYLEFEFLDNGTKEDTDINLTKEELIWPLIVITTPRDLSAVSDCLDENDIEEIERIYGNVINEHSERFDFITRVRNAYLEYKKNEQSPRIKDFVNHYANDFIEEFEGLEIDENLKYDIIKLIIYSILRKSNLIGKIKTAVNL